MVNVEGARIERPVRVLCWSERTEPGTVYPEGINGAVAAGLAAAGGFETRVGNLADDGQGLAELDWADVLVWFSHLKHREVSDQNVRRVVLAVRERGMGYVPLHSSIGARSFHEMLDHRVAIAGWREDGCPSVVSVVQPDHPIAQGIDRMFVIPIEEMYAEPFAIKPPDELVFVSSFAGGEMLRSGCCWHAGEGRVFYFQPGHETYPVYFQREIRQIMANACRWAAARTQDLGTGTWWQRNASGSGQAEGIGEQGSAHDRGETQNLRELVALQERVGAVDGAPEVTGEEIERLVARLRWSSREVRGGMDAYVRVRAAARGDALARVADELQQARGSGGNAALLALAARLRAQCLTGDVPADVKRPQLWPGTRTAPELDASRVRREQQIGFSLGLAEGAGQIHVAAGGKV